MQRRPTSNTRGSNAYEKRFQFFLKHHDCVWCGHPGPGIVDHCRGSCFKHRKVLIGHFFCLPQCVQCDTQKTIHGKRLGNEAHMWLKMHDEYHQDNDIPPDVFNAIQNWGK